MRIIASMPRWHYYLICSVISLLFCRHTTEAQSFIRSRINITLESPWEIIYGPDNYLWISESRGTVVRVNPETGTQSVVFSAPDYFAGDESEKAPCGLNIGANTYGMALHPDFLNPDNAFIYLIYSYNNGTEDEPETLFKIVKLTWDAATGSVVAHEDLATELANGYDHFGGRMIAISQKGKDYIYYSTGDTGPNHDDCYETPELNPNNFAQDPYVKTGKIHRIYIDGTIPDDNPIPGNSFFTRGHRNPQGLAYNPEMDVLYAIEHGHTTDDEVNVLEAGMNYGWKDVKGYHDGNYPDELEYVNNYMPHPDIQDDGLREPLFSWGAVEETGGNYLEWPTVAPSDGIYYSSDGIPEWTNSLLVVTLKAGSTTYQEVFQFRLNPDGVTLAPSTPEDPNPRQFFRNDQFFNGRLRDIAVSPDGTKLYLITNNRNTNNPIIVYTADITSSTRDLGDEILLSASGTPNPFAESTKISFEIKRPGRVRVDIHDVRGQRIKTLYDAETLAGIHSMTWNGTDDSGSAHGGGIYFYTIQIGNSMKSGKMLMLN